jgi:multidrug efflux system membrane fusion protein
MSIRKTIKERPWILAVSVAIGVTAWVASGTIGREEMAISDGSATTPALTAAAARVQVQTQAAQPITRYISVYGRSAPARQVELKAETEGRVIAINARRGERLSRGAAILSLDMRDREARMEQARAGVKEHQTAYEGQLKLKADGYISDTQIAETLAKLETARTELTRAELDLDYRVIRAPFDGVILERQVEVGDFVREGDEVVSFVDNTSIIVTGSVAEQDARYVRAGIVANAVLVTGQEVTGRIRYMAPVAEQATRTFLVELEVPNPEGSLPAGVTAEMRIPGGEMLAQKISPSLLTLDSAGSIGVKTIDQFNRVSFYPVEIARTDSDGIWVAGLPETANVITIGQGYVAVGDEVEAVYANKDAKLAAEIAQ